jgi:hypothetical protein
VDPDPPRHRHRLDAGLAHTLLTEHRHDSAFLAATASALNASLAYLRGDVDGQAKTPTGRRHHRRTGRAHRARWPAMAAARAP